MPETYIAREIINDVRTIRFGIEGDLDLFAAPSIKTTIMYAVSDTPSELVIVDLRKVEFLDSAGLALLLYFHKAEKVDGKMRVIVRPNSQPERVLELGQFRKVIDIHAEE